MHYIKMRTPTIIFYIGYKKLLDTFGVAGDPCTSEFGGKTAPGSVEKILRKQYPGSKITRTDAWNWVIFQLELNNES